MSALLRGKAWRLAIVLLGAAVLSAGVILFQNDTSEAFPGMPAEQRAYWEWVSTIGAGESAALDAGFKLLESQPNLKKLYGRLSGLCISLERIADCEAAFASADPGRPDVQVYRDAATAQLATDLDAAAWKRVASATALEPSSARIVVDEVRGAQAFELLDEIEALWEQQVEADSSLAGASFGLGYAAVLRNDWDRASAYLQHTKELLPNDSEPDREFGRMYFMRGNFEGFEGALEMGIQSAQQAYDVEQEIVLAGNLGLGQLNWEGDLEAAGAMFTVALERATAIDLGPSIADGGYRLANVRARQNRYSDALALLETAIKEYEIHIPGRLSEPLVLKAQILKNIYRYTEAEEVLARALEEATLHRFIPGQADALLGLAQIETQTGRYEEAHEVADSALALASQYGITQYIMIAHSILGEIERLSGNFVLAKGHFSQGLQIARESGSDVRVAEFARELGISALQISDLVGAERYFELYDELSSDSELNRAEALYWIGATFVSYENFDLGLQKLSEAQQLAQGRDNILVGRILRENAYARYQLGLYQEALMDLQSAETYLSHDRLQSFAVKQLAGQILVRLGKFEQALEYFDDARASEDQLEWSAVYWEALHGAALAHWKLANIEEAEDAFRESIALVEALRSNLTAPDDRSFYAHDKVEVYDDFAAFLREQGRADEAFHINERARSRTLLDLLYSAQQTRKLDLANPVDLAIEMARQVRSVENELVSNTAAEPGSHRESDLYRGSRTAYLRRARTRAQSQFQEASLNIFGSKRLFTFDPIDADSASAILRDDEALLVYNLSPRSGEDSDRSVVYIVTKDSIATTFINTNLVDIANEIAFFRSEIEHRSATDRWIDISSKLYDTIVGPALALVPDNINHLHIVPHGPLHYLPFAALIDPDGRFLVETYTLSSVPSASILRLARQSNPRQWSYMILLADPDDRLPGAREEVLAIASEAPSRRHALVGADASQETFESVSSQYDIIHFATHAKFDRRTPWDSYLELHDGLLTVNEIARLNLDAYLVTLSACETALASGIVADIPNGDEWVGLNQAFLAAGTPTVLASLWAIDDIASNDIMTRFYRILSHDGKAAALAAVQREAILDAKLKHPFYWAAFTVIGDPL